MNNEEYEEMQELAEECERFFWYVNDHFDEYCNFCETHDPFEFFGNIDIEVYEE